jgi:hypothetical protein
MNIDMRLAYLINIKNARIKGKEQDNEIDYLTSLVLLRVGVYLFLVEERSETVVGEFDCKAIVYQTGCTAQTTVEPNRTVVEVVHTLYSTT